MRIITLALALALSSLFSCQQEQQNTTAEAAINLQVDQSLNFENLQLFPIEASAEFISDNAKVGNYQSLAHAMEQQRFRITEKKPYGRFTDPGAVNTLTVQNKTNEHIFLMAGEVVQGGNQDRVVAEDQIIAAASITDIPVFCVERGRWQPREEEGQPAASGKKVYAFNNYYNVASGEVRRSVKHTKNQQEVWKSVGEVTAINNAEVETGTYTALETSEGFTNQRNKYLDFFADKMKEKNNVVGVLAVTGNKVIAADIFGHPSLFQKEFNALLHSYVTEAITNGSTPQLSETKLEAYTQQLYKQFAGEQNQFIHNGAMVHYTDLP